MSLSTHTTGWDTLNDNYSICSVQETKFSYVDSIRTDVSIFRSCIVFVMHVMKTRGGFPLSPKQFVIAGMAEIRGKEIN